MDSFTFPPEILALNETTPFGHGLLPYFPMKPGFTNINHGSVGAPPRVVIECRRHYEDRMEECPDAWFMYEYGRQVDKVTAELRKFVNVSESPTDGPGVGDLVLVRNASFAMNSIFRSWPWKRGDKLLFLSEAYAMTKLAATFLQQSIGVDVVQVPMRVPITDDQLIRAVEEALDQHGASVKLAAFSHISAAPAFIMPVTRLIALCRSRQVPCVIDGAHALGQIDIDLTQLDPDFYIGNGHKWFMTARGAAFLYTKKKWRPQLHPVIITYGFGHPELRKEFRYQGVSDYSAYFTFSTAIKFRSLLGEKRIQKYCHNLCLEGSKLIAQIWGTELLITDESQLAAMCHVRLPLGDPKPANLEGFIKQIVDGLLLHNKTYLLVNFSQDGAWYTRISAQIYNELEDFKMVAEAFLQMRDQIRDGMKPSEFLSEHVNGDEK